MSQVVQLTTQLYEAWVNMANNGLINSSIIRPVIADSWKRSQSLAVNPKVTRMILKEIKDFRLSQEQKVFLEISIPIMRHLYQLVEGSGFIVALADRDGYILEAIGDQDVLERANKKNSLVKGANWSEESIGTNAIGTAFRIGASLQVFAAEHYWVGAHEWTCSGAPIRNPSGKIIGVLSMSGNFEKVHSHTLGMVDAAANSIENILRINEINEKLAVANEYKNTIIETMVTGIFSVNRVGEITQMNNKARQMLELPEADFIGCSVAEILGTKQTLAKKIFSYSNCTDEEIHLETRKGKLHCTVTCKPIKINGENIGVVVILSEIKNVRQLVRKMVGAEAKFTFDDLLGKNPSLQQIKENAKIAASSVSNVLLLGESGTGKEVFAQAIHNESSRRQGPFVAVNCAALPRELVGSELFGYTEGAFTGAKRGGSPGKFELADGGTLFLDEIGEMPLEMQAFLLRALQEKQITRIGGHTVIPVDVRVIAATNRNLWDEISKGNFRQDLFFRLNVFTINLLPLREFKDDIPELVNFFMQKFNKRLGKQVESIDPLVMERLSNYSWPGNIRELENLMERAINLCQGKVIQAVNFPEYITVNGDTVESGLSTIKENERELIIRFINLCNGNLSSVAKKLGISRPTLYSKLKSYKIELSRY